MSEDRNTEWDASLGANPDTCLHFIAVSIYGANLSICFSCSATLSTEYMQEFDWTHDGLRNVWVRKSIREMRRERAARRNRTYEFEVIVYDYPRVIKLEDKYFEENYLIDYGVDRWTQIHPGELEQYLRSRGVR